MRQFVTRFFRDESGSNALEYGMIVALVSLAVVAGATVAGTAMGNMFSAIGSKMSAIAGSI